MNIQPNFAQTVNLQASRMRRFALDDEGVTAVEYGLLAALIAVVILGAVSTTGTSLATIYTAWSSAVVAAL